MAVIITNMDMPENCGACVLRDKCGVLYFGSRYVEYTERDPDCPLKSTDEMIEEIEDYKIMQNPTGYILNVIHKYCGKENTDEMQ